MTPTPWWQQATAYQIYPASFCDSNADGIGDIPGIISKLDYLQALGIGFIWLSPVYASPMIDNGYDISDYQAINPTFGTLEDFDALVRQARARGIGIVMDLVVNHTSDQHAWFTAARQSRTAALRDFYIWRDPAPGGGPPTPLQSNFGGPAWTLDPLTNQYYLHLFAPQQPDLDWSNPHLRQTIYTMMNWWLDRGIAGFRIDVIELLGKDIDANIIVNGPNLHPYIAEMHAAAFAGRDCVTVGETWSVTPKNALLYCGRTRHELSMVFQFDHVVRFWDPKFGKWKPLPIDLVPLKQIFAEWQLGLMEDGWNSLFWSNHDLPRAVSRYGDTGPHRIASAKMLATILHLMRGTPYIYQGEEIGMTNAGFTHIGEYRDLETLNFHRIQIEAGVTEADFLAGARANSRDNARTPMHWDATPTSGFTTGTPWIDINPNHATINVAADRADPDGIFAHYRTLIELRTSLAIVRHGDFELLLPDHAAVFAYRRRRGDTTLTVIANFYAPALTLDIPAQMRTSGRDVFSGAARTIEGTIALGAYETIVIYDAPGR